MCQNSGTSKESLPKCRGMVGDGTLAPDTRTEVSSSRWPPVVPWVSDYLSAPSFIPSCGEDSRREDSNALDTVGGLYVLVTTEWHSEQPWEGVRNGRGCSQLETEGSSVLWFWPTLVSSSSIPFVRFPLLIFFLPKVSFLCKEGTLGYVPRVRLQGGCLTHRSDLEDTRG